MTREELMSLKNITDVNEKATKLYFFMMSQGFEDLCDLVSVTEVCERIISEAEQENLVGVGNLIQGITEWSADYFVVDGYSNYSDCTWEHLNDLINEMLESGEFEEDEEEA